MASVVLLGAGCARRSTAPIPAPAATLESTDPDDQEPRNRIWTFDYPGQKLLLHPEPIGCDTDPVPLGFLSENGERMASYPRIEAEIDGQTHDLLFDTGATVQLTDQAYEELGGAGLRARATSFIIRSVFDRWRQAHPDWRVIEAADHPAFVAEPGASFRAWSGDNRSSRLIDRGPGGTCLV